MTHILLTGATGYIGKRLLITLLQQGHTVTCSVRDIKRFHPPTHTLGKCNVIEMDLLHPESLTKIPPSITHAYYLVHSMASSAKFDTLEAKCAQNFTDAMANTQVKQVIYLSGMVNQSELSQHLASRKQVETILSSGSFALTTLRAGIIIGSGSASFEIIRDLVEKLPLMVAPKWINTRCQPIAIRDVITLLTGCLDRTETFNHHFDIGGPDILTYKDMLLGYAKTRGLKRFIITVPVLTPRLSSYWLFFVTATSFKLARALVNSMTIEVICSNNQLQTILKNTPLTYKEALEVAFKKIESNSIISSWKDAMVSSRGKGSLTSFIEVPTHGCFVDRQERKVTNREACLTKIWKIGGNTGWYYGNSLWRIRGFFDKLAGGVGLRRGRTHPTQINTGDSLDFWRVLYANRQEGRLLLFAEMRLPGDAWLEFTCTDSKLVQTATFRPLGVWGRLYWRLVTPFHWFIFKKMATRLAENTR